MSLSLLFAAAFFAAAAAVPAPATTSAAASAPATAAPAAPRGLVEEDVQPSVGLTRTDLVEVRVGGLIQLHSAVLAGADSLVENGDLANRAGFRLRRARFGLETRYRQRFGLLLAVNPLESDPDTGTVSDAKLSFDAARWLRVTGGTGKVPFSKGALVSSRRILGIERPLSVSAITPSRRLGVSAEGELWDGRIAYLAGLLNGTEGFSQGNAFGGVLYGGRLELALFGAPRLGRPDGEGDGLSVGASALLDDGTSVTGTAYSADLSLCWFGVSLHVEALTDSREPVAAPLTGSSIPAAVERSGLYGEVAYAMRLFGTLTQLVGRVERFDDNRSLQDAGDVLLVLGGVNAELVEERLRAQLQYLVRRELAGLERDNDGLVLSLQGSF